MSDKTKRFWCGTPTATKRKSDKPLWPGYASTAARSINPKIDAWGKS